MTLHGFEVLSECLPQVKLFGHILLTASFKPIQTCTPLKHIQI